MYLDAMEFLEDERDGWAPFEALATLDDDALERPVEAAHGWSGRDLMGHLLAWQGCALEAARELAVDETSTTIRRTGEDWDRLGGDAVNAAITSSWAARSLTEVRDVFTTQPGELRGYLTVVPEIRWLKAAETLRWFRDQTIDHYDEHREDLRQILEAAGRA